MKNTLIRLGQFLLKSVNLLEQKHKLKSVFKKYDRVIVVPCERKIGQQIIQYMRVYGFNGLTATLVHQFSGDLDTNYILRALGVKFETDCPYPHLDGIK